MTVELNNVFASWARIGAALNVRAAPRTPDLEELILDTATLLPQDARLLPIAASWLVQYPLLVARHRLAALVNQATAFRAHARLGLLLDTVRHAARTRHFDQVLRLCRSAKPAQPLFLAQQENPVWRQAAAAEASPLARRWGLWCQAVEVRDDIIRPASWAITRNPCFYDRAVLRGDLRLSILAALRADPNCGASESSLSRAVGANRSAARYALDALEQSCHVARATAGKRTAIHLIEPRWLRAA